MSHPSFIRGRRAEGFALRCKDKFGEENVIPKVYEEGYKEGEIDAFAIIRNVVKNDPSMTGAQVLEYVESLIENRKTFFPTKFDGKDYELYFGDFPKEEENK